MPPGKSTNNFSNPWSTRDAARQPPPSEYALLIAINIFSADQPNVQEPSRVEALQQPYVDALLSYTRIKRTQDQLRFP